MCFALILPGGTGRHRDSDGLGYGMLKPLEKWQESFCERPAKPAKSCQGLKTQK